MTFISPPCFLLSVPPSEAALQDFSHRQSWTGFAKQTWQVLADPGHEQLSRVSSHRQSSLLLVITLRALCAEADDKVEAALAQDSGLNHSLM